MKEEVTRFIDSIEGFGNLIVSKPDGTVEKHGFKNTITKHFRESLIKAILYGDEEIIFDDSGNETPNSNPEGYYWSNKLIAYQFKVTVGESGVYPTPEKKNLLQSGITQTLDFSGLNVGESRINVIGNIDTNQAQLIEGFNPQEIRMGKDLNPTTGEWTSFNQQKAFDFAQNVFVGYTSMMDDNAQAIPGLKQPQFRPARENLKLERTADGTKDSTENIDKYSNKSKTWWDWEQDTTSTNMGYGGTKATIRQSMGAGTWIPSAYRTDNEQFIEYYDLRNGADSDLVMWKNNSIISTDPSKSADIAARKAVATGDSNHNFPSDRQFSADNGYGYQELQRGTITSEFYGSKHFDGVHSIDFYPCAFELYIPEERWYWSFENHDSSNNPAPVENTANWDIQNPDNMWYTRDVETRKAGVITAIEVQNFPSKMMYGGSTTEVSVDPETLAFYVPASDDEIEIDRNDNLTVEYNFKFTTPTGSTLIWNGIYLDELARAINPVQDTEQVTNSANKIQMTGIVLYEDGVFKSTKDTPNLDLNEIGHSTQSDGHTLKRTVPDYIAQKAPLWYQSEDAEYKTPNVGWLQGDGNDVVAKTIVSRLKADGTLNPTFARIWCSPFADKFANVTDSVTTWLGDSDGADFLDNNNIDNLNDATGIHSTLEGALDFTNWPKGGIYNGQPHNYDYVSGSKTWNERRSYYAQTNETRSKKASGDEFKDGNYFDYFQHMVSLMYDATDGKLDFNNNRCQIFISPYGNIANAIVRHARLTNWLNDYRAWTYIDATGKIVAWHDPVTGVLNGTIEGNTPVFNIETIWQNGLRLFGTEAISQTDLSINIDGFATAVDMKVADFTKLHKYSDDATETLTLSKDFLKESFLMPDIDTTESISVISLRATTDARFMTTPKFYTVNYGSQYGHPVPGDMYDQKIESQWNLKEDWVDTLDVLSTAAGLPNDQVDWTRYYKVEDRDLIPRVNENELEHYLGENDPTGFGEQGYLVKDTNGNVVFPELILGTKASGMTTLHDQTETSIVGGVEVTEVKYPIKTQAVIAKSLNPPPDYDGVKRQIIFGGELYSHTDGKILWNFRDNPVIVSGYTDENALVTEEPYDYWTEIHEDYHQITITAVTNVDLFQFTATDAAARFASYNLDLNLATATVGQTFTVVEPLVHPSGNTHKLEVEDTVKTTYEYTVGSNPVHTVEKETTILGALKQAIDGGTGTEVYGVGDRFTIQDDTAIVGSGYTDLRDNKPVNRWHYEDDYVFVAGEGTVKLVVGGSTAVGDAAGGISHDAIVGTEGNDDDGNKPPNALWDIGDRFIIATWQLDSYDQFLGQTFTNRDDVETITTWDIAEINYPERSYGDFGNVNAISTSTGLSVITLNVDDHGADGTNIIGTNNPDSVGNLPPGGLTTDTPAGTGWAANDTYVSGTLSNDTRFISDEIKTLVLAQSEYTTYSSSKTHDNYKNFLVRLKQLIGSRGMQKVSLDDYVHRKIEFDPEIYEKKILTQYGIRYTYIKQGTEPQLGVEGTYSTSDSLLANYTDALSRGYRETAPFRVNWNDTDSENHVFNFPFINTKVDDMKLNFPESYGWFAADDDGHTFGKYVGTTWNDNWGFTKAEMETKFPIYKPWAERMHPTARIVYAGEGSGGPITIKGGEFPIPKSFRVNAEIHEPLSENSEDKIRNDGSTTSSTAEALMDQIAAANDGKGNIPFANLSDMIEVVKDRRANDNSYFNSPGMLMQFVTSIAPHGFKEFYEYDNATPNKMRLSLPHPDQHMFYGVLDIGEGSTGGVNIGTSGPTWTPGDQAQITWTVKPPVKDTANVENEGDED